jgi:hypothetical protein
MRTLLLHVLYFEYFDKNIPGVWVPLADRKAEVLP